MALGHFRSGGYAGDAVFYVLRHHLRQVAESNLFYALIQMCMLFAVFNQRCLNFSLSKELKSELVREFIQLAMCELECWLTGADMADFWAVFAAEEEEG